MSVTSQAAKLLIQTVLTISSAAGLMYTAYAPKPVDPPAPVVVQAQQEVRSPEFERAFFQAAKVYGKAGCGDQHLAEITAKHAISSGLPAGVVAAMIATESTCNPMAVSNRGAVGLTQVNVKVWSKRYDFTKINLLNPEDSLKVGTSILSDQVKQYGLRAGLHRYYGEGGDDGLGLGGSGYVEKVLALAGKA
jgi:soluble lytic murein transglycosylase-like protein